MKIMIRPYARTMHPVQLDHVLSRFDDDVRGLKARGGFTRPEPDPGQLCVEPSEQTAERCAL
jgi:hypothetical protein